MTTPTTTPAISLRSPSDIVAAIPHLLGFQPRQSLVILALDVNRIMFTARVDLTDAWAAMLELTSKALRAGVTKTVCVVFDDNPDADHREIVGPDSPIRLTMRDDSIGLVVRGNRYYCVDGCCDDAGFPLADAVAVQAAYALQGSSVLPTRDAVGDTLDGEPLTVLAESAPLIGAEQWVREAMHMQSDPRHRPDDYVALGMLRSLARKDFRDRVFGSFLANEIPYSLVEYLTQRAPVQYKASALGVVGMCALLSGRTVVAGFAARACLELDPSDTLAELVMLALDQNVPPAEIRTALADTPTL